MSAMKQSGWRMSSRAARRIGDVAYEGMAILYRTNAQSRPLEEAFRFRGIPYRLIGAISFYERREVEGSARLSAADCQPRPTTEAFLRVVNVPRRGIGDASLARKLVRAATGWQKPLLEAARRASNLSDLRPNVPRGAHGGGIPARPAARRRGAGGSRHGARDDPRHHRLYERTWRRKAPRG